MAEQEKGKKPAGCQIVKLANRTTALLIVRSFFGGDNTRKLAKVWGLSRGGVEELVRTYSRPRVRAVAR